jgi:ferredoxin-NADP reductase
VAAANVIYQASAGIYPFTAGQYIELRVNNGTGGALPILNLAYTSPIFWAAKIG